MFYNLTCVSLFCSLQTVELSKRQLCDCFDQEIEDDIELMPFVPRHILPPPRQSTPQLRNVVSLHKELTSKIVSKTSSKNNVCCTVIDHLITLVWQKFEVHQTFLIK